MYRLLEKTKWARPECYGGFNPEGDYIIASKHRDSDLLTESNFDYIEKTLKAIPYKEDENMESTPVYSWRAGHWAVGYIDYLMIDKNAPKEIKDAAEKILDDLESYPSLDEDDLSEREWNRAQEFWESLDLREKIKLCADNGISIFSARESGIPQADNGGIFESCLGY